MARRGGYGYEQPRGRGLSLARVATIGVIAVLLVAIGFQLADHANAPAPAPDAQGSPALDASDQPQPEPQPVSLTVTFAGDCTLGTDSAFDYATSLNAMFEAVDDPGYFLRNVQPLFAADDLTIVNMEGTLTTSNARAD